MTLPLLSVGAVGVVGTSTHFSGLGTKAMIEAYVAGDVAEALAWHRRLLPIYTGIFATQGCILVKAGLELQGRGVGGVRSPLVVATAAEIDGLRASLAAAGLADLRLCRRNGTRPRRRSALDQVGRASRAQPIASVRSGVCQESQRE